MADPVRTKKGGKISGVYDLKTHKGKMAASRLKFVKQDGDTARIDAGELKVRIDAYIYDNSLRDDEGNVTGYKPVSRAGLRCALDNISPSTYQLWLQGYVDEDEFGAAMGRNNELADAMRAGDCFIAKVLSESHGPGESTRIKLLTSMGEISPANGEMQHPLRLLTGKHAKRAE